MLVETWSLASQSHLAVLFMCVVTAQVGIMSASHGIMHVNCAQM